MSVVKSAVIHERARMIRARREIEKLTPTNSFVKPLYLAGKA